MKYLDFTWPTAAENLACDEALLDQCEQDGAREVLRVWETDAHYVVLGYANRAALEVNVAACRKRGVPILRRCSGGGCVLQGPGCLNYSLVLKNSGSSLASVTETNCFIMKRHATGLTSLLRCPVAIQ